MGLIRRILSSLFLWPYCLVALLGVCSSCARDATRYEDGSAAEWVETLPEPALHHPVIAGATVAPDSCRPGDRVTLCVGVRVAGGHYLHPPEEQDSHFTPVGVSVSLPPGLSAVGAWRYPEPTHTSSGASRYEGNLVFSRSLRVSRSVKSTPIRFEVVLRHQACSDELCWSPTEVALPVTIAIESNKEAKQ